MTDRIDYAAKGRQIARLALRGAWNGKPSAKPDSGYVRIVGLDISKLTEAQAKELADAYAAAIKR